MKPLASTSYPKNPAPWVEAAPGAGPAWVDDLLTMPNDGWCYEVVEEVLVRVVGSGQRATGIAAILLGALIGYARPWHQGVVTGADGVYKFPYAETGLLPDVGFYRAERQVLVVDADKPIPFAPDLAVEGAAPSQTARDLAAKAWQYLAGGTRLVWAIWPQARTIDVWKVDTHLRPSATLGIGDHLDGADVVPGFAHPVADLFDS